MRLSPHNEPINPYISSGFYGEFKQAFANDKLT